MASRSGQVKLETNRLDARFASTAPWSGCAVLGWNTVRSFSRREVVIALQAGAAACWRSAPAGGRENWGVFKGSVATEWLRDGRNMRLLKAFEYVDPDGVRWPVPELTVVDGASIPSVFWSIIGGPFEGLYREPSVIHDHFCDRRTRPSRHVHRAFYQAMRCAGVSASKAWLMYQAVDRFGPQWADPKVDPACEVLDENYDFSKCARNSDLPEVRNPKIDRTGLEAFVRSIEGQADAKDIAALRRAIKQVP